MLLQHTPHGPQVSPGVPRCVQGHCLARAQVSRTFEVEGVGSVVLGTVLQGYVSVGQQLILVRLLVPCFNLLRS